MSATAEETALLSVAGPAQADASANTSDRWAALGQIPVRLSVQVAMARLRIRDLMSLAPGALLETQHLETNDVAIGTVGARLAWCEFETVGERIAVRLTRIA